MSVSARDVTVMKGRDTSENRFFFRHTDVLTAVRL